jgi:hypothetical protein
MHILRGPGFCPATILGRSRRQTGPRVGNAQAECSTVRLAMGLKLRDEEISRYVAESKTLPLDFRARLRLKPRHGYLGAEMTIVGDAGTTFRVIIRQSRRNPLDFSVILGVLLPGTSDLFRLRRYNGKHGEHTNRIEGDRMTGFHVHYATERYQLRGMAEDSFATPTNRHGSSQEALECLLSDCGFIEDDSSKVLGWLPLGPEDRNDRND